jgi:hypothetical protein
MSYTPDELLNLLPAVYRVRDEQSGQLQALIEILAREANVVDADIAQLYDNWFIETCQDWVAPYIGDLIAATPLYTVATKILSQRAYVANTLGYRRRSGTLAVLEQAATDVSNWASHAVEFFQILGWAQNVNHVRLGKGGTVDIRPARTMELIDGPFDFAAHTAESRNIRSGRGRYNIPNIGVFLFRLADYPLDRVTARSTGNPGQYFAHPSGLDRRLFNRRNGALERLTREQDLPVSLRRLEVYHELETVRQSLVDSAQAHLDPASELLVFFQQTDPILEVRYRPPDNPGPQPFQTVPIEEVLICNLEQWPAQRPSQQRLYRPASGGVAVPRAIQVAVDPVVGRLVFAAGIDPVAVEVSSYHGFPGDLGGGPYDRTLSPGTRAAAAATALQIEVNSEFPAIARPHVATLQEAVNRWNALPAGISAVILISDSRSYDLAALPVIQIPERSRLVILAAEGQRPHLLGDLHIQGTAPAASDSPGGVLLDGLLVTGSCLIPAGNLGDLSISHSTFEPPAGGLTVNTGNNHLKVRMERCITGLVSLEGALASSDFVDSILTGANGATLVAPEATVQIESCTFDGLVSVRVLNASNSIFLQPVTSVRHQIGCVRFCYVPRGSATPQRFRCQPDLALLPVTDASEADRIRARMVPNFTTRAYPRPAYFQLTASTGEEVLTGAEDGSEMGAWNFLKQPQRETNVRTVLNEYLRAGLDAGSFYAT